MNIKKLFLLNFQFLNIPNLLVPIGESLWICKLIGLYGKLFDIVIAKKSDHAAFNCLINLNGIAITIIAWKQILFFEFSGILMKKSHRMKAIHASFAEPLFKKADIKEENRGLHYNLSWIMIRIVVLFWYKKTNSSVHYLA